MATVSTPSSTPEGSSARAAGIIVQQNTRQSTSAANLLIMGHTAFLLIAG